MTTRALTRRLLIAAGTAAGVAILWPTAAQQLDEAIVTVMNEKGAPSPVACPSGPATSR